MTLLDFSSSLNDWANGVSILIPLILFGWFIYAQRQSFYNEYLGLYAGFSPQPETEGYRIYGGMILSMKDINSSGYFRGEVDYSEKKFTNDTEKLLNDGVYFFFGDIDYSLWKWPFDRNPFIKEQNRTYEGVLYFVDRLDIHLDTQDIYNFLQATYKVKYYRDYRAIELQLVKREERMKNPLPEKIFLYKDVKLNLSPYKDVKQIIFRDTHRRHNDA